MIARIKSAWEYIVWCFSYQFVEQKKKDDRVHRYCDKWGRPYVFAEDIDEMREIVLKKNKK